ncbi:MAG TPA: response regulator [Polyangiaceae bacterium]|nr:response regulator [Polyangiaceae bacterium]
MVMSQLGPIQSMAQGSYEEKVRILIVEDDDDLRMLMAFHLRMCGYAVIEFRDGEALLDYIGNLMKRGTDRSKHADMVLLDINLPGFSGLQVLTSLRRAQLGNPIIMMTGQRRDAEGEAFRLGATALVRKPFDIEEVVKMIDRVKSHTARAVTNDDASGTYQLQPFCM